MDAEVNGKQLLNSKPCLGNHLYDHRSLGRLGPLLLLLTTNSIITHKMQPVLAHTASADPHTVLTKPYIIKPVHTNTAFHALYFSLHWFLKWNVSIGRLLRHLLSYRVNYVYRDWYRLSRWLATNPDGKLPTNQKIEGKEGRVSHLNSKYFVNFYTLVING
jgi:hypothetical protein